MGPVSRGARRSLVRARAASVARVAPGRGRRRQSTAASVGRLHPLSPCGPHGDSELTGVHRHGLLRIVTDTDVRLWRRVHMDLVRYAGCVCRPSC
ncbi:putative leader peptide [Streptomyces rishiriensis]|uniref:putative leader peptide n=1 Tax=Streptomyces rishiriensis TaxID=68264 RepID=UPI0033C9C96F